MNHFSKLAALPMLGAAAAFTIPALASLTAPKGYRLEGSLRGVGDATSAIGGGGAGFLAGAKLGQLFTRGRVPLMMSPGKGAEIGALIGGGLGAAGGLLGMNKVMGTPGWKTAATRIPFANQPPDINAVTQDTNAGIDLLKKLYQHPEKQTGVNDVLDGSSMTMPLSAVRAVAGAGGGALAGNALASLLTPEIKPDMTEMEADQIRHKRHVGSGIGAVLGTLAATRPDLSKMLAQVRTKLSV